jgi:hypothetical protein
MTFERVINGINKYINAEIYATMNDWQEILARIAIGRMLGNTEQLKQSLVSNGFLRTFALMDENGNVDIETLARDLKAQIAAKGKMTISLPLMPALTFKPEDVDILHRYIMEG